jgi:hypothetical protein
MMNEQRKLIELLHSRRPELYKAVARLEEALGYLEDTDAKEQAAQQG